MDESQLSHRSERALPWCAGCGHGEALGALEAALAPRRAPLDLTVLASPGCASWVAGAFRGGGAIAPAGLLLPMALGVQAARPAALVVAVGGDRDVFATGGGHLDGASARAARFPLIVLDNGIAAAYGPRPRPTPARSHLADAVRSSATYVAQALASDRAASVAAIRGALAHVGFGVVLLRTTCGTHDPDHGDLWLRERAREVPESHDPADRAAAARLAEEEGVLWCGVLVRAGKAALD